MIKQRNITLIVVHCTASRCTSNLTPEALDSMHKRQGFVECGYHYYITKDGTIHHMPDVPLTPAPTHKNKVLKSFSASCCSPTGEQRFAVTVTYRPTSTTTEP